MKRKAGIRLVCAFAGAAVVLGTAAGCSDELAGGLPVTAVGANLYARLETNHHAVLLSIVAPYDTVQLSTIPIDVDGNEWFPDHLTVAERDSLLAANPPRYVSQDESRVRVSAAGLIRAVGTTSPTGTVRVIATRQLGNVTWADTTLVRVLNVPSPPKIKTFRLQPSDSLKVAAGSTLPMVLTALDSADNPISGVVTYARSNDGESVKIGTSSGGLSGWNVRSVAGGLYRLGSARIRSQAYVYGIAVTDSVTIMNGYYIERSTTMYTTIASNGAMSPRLSAQDIAVGPGGVVAWTNDTNLESVSIEFDDPSTVLAAIAPAKNTGGGNIIDIPFDSTLMSSERTRYRRFLAPGTYPFRTNPYGLTGRVIVKDR